MKALLILPLAGLLLPPRFALRLGGLGIVALLGLLVFGNTPYNPGAGHGLGLALIGFFVVLFFGAIIAGLIARGLWHAWRGTPIGPGDIAVPPALDQMLVGLAMAVPAGLAALALGQALSGHAGPLAVHLGLLAGLAALAVGSAFAARGMVRAAGLGLSLWLAVIVADSMRLERQLRADLPQDRAYCLAIGPDRLPPERLPPLMGLTAPKPIHLQIADPGHPRFLRWSFRWHGFVPGGLNPRDVPCTPVLHDPAPP